MVGRSSGTTLDVSPVSGVDESRRSEGDRISGGERVLWWAVEEGLGGGTEISTWDALLDAMPDVN